MKTYPMTKSKEISDTVGSWLRAALFRKGGGGALHPRKRRRSDGATIMTNNREGERGNGVVNSD